MKRVRRPAGDEGMSLIDLVVGMTLMVIFMSMFTGAVVMMNRSFNKTEALNSGSAQLNQAFLTLDKTVRYAAAISPPGSATGGWYVELRTLNTGREVCTQLRVEVGSQQLQQRSWQLTGGTASNVSAWVQLASSVTNGGATAGSADQPFALEPQGDTAAFQRLMVRLTADTGAAGSRTTSRSSYTFTAVNSTVPPPTAPICQEVGRP